MRSSKSLSDFEEAWKEFLRRLERIWNKTQAHYGKSPKWNGWQSKYESLRKRDELLCYLVNARGAEEHTVSEVISSTPGEMTINPAEGNFMYLESLVIDNGTVKAKSPQKLKIDLTPARVELLPVVNRGRKYDVPKNHLGRPIDARNVPLLAEAAMQFYDEALANAEAFFVK